MKFKNRNGHSLEIIITGWEFPNEDWLMVKIRGEDSNGVWESLDPSLTYDEAQELSDWLVSPNSFQDSKLQFMEPELELEFQQGQLRVFLEWGLRPPWKPTDPNNEELYCLEFDVEIKQLKEQAANFKQQLKNVSNSRHAI